MPLFCDTSLAERIERVEAQLIARLRWRPGAGRQYRGLRSHCWRRGELRREGSRSAGGGLGFSGMRASRPGRDRADLRVPAVRRCRSRLAHLANPADRCPAERGYGLVSFENVLGLALSGESERDVPPGIEVRPSGTDEFGSWLEVQIEALPPSRRGSSLARGVPPRGHRAGRAGFRSGRRHALRRVARWGHGRSGASFHRRRSSLNSLARRPLPRTAAGECRPRSCRPGSPMPPLLAAISRSSPPSQDRNPSRTCSPSELGSALYPAPSWSSPEPAGSSRGSSRAEDPALEVRRARGQRRELWRRGGGSGRCRWQGPRVQR